MWCWCNVPTGAPSWWLSAAPGTLRSLTVTTATCLWLTSALWRNRTAFTARTATKSSLPRPVLVATPRSWGYVPLSKMLLQFTYYKLQITVYKSTSTFFSYTFLQLKEFIVLAG